MACHRVDGERHAWSETLNHTLQRTTPSVTAHVSHRLRPQPPSPAQGLRQPSPSLSLRLLDDQQAYQTAMRLFLYGWLLIFMFLAAMSVLIAWGAGSFRLAYQHRQAQGIVVGRSPSQHGRSVYRFQVGGHTYSSEGSQGHDYIPLGELVAVYYDPADPRLTCLDNPVRHLYLNLLGGLFYAGVLASVFYGTLRFLPAIAPTMDRPRGWPRCKSILLT